VGAGPGVGVVPHDYGTRSRARLPVTAVMIRSENFAVDLVGTLPHEEQPQ